MLGPGPDPGQHSWVEGMPLGKQQQGPPQTPIVFRRGCALFAGFQMGFQPVDLFGREGGRRVGVEVPLDPTC